MTRFVPSTALRALVGGALILGLFGAGAAPVAAANKDKSQLPSDLLGTAYNFAGQASIITVTNTGKDPVRALITVQDASHTFVGCALRTVRTGEQSTIFLTDKSKTTTVDESLLTVTVYGLNATGSLLGKGVQSADGLVGIIAQVKEGDPTLQAITQMFEISAPQVDRQAAFDACMSGALSGLDDANLATPTGPTSWEATQKTSSSSSSNGSKKKNGN